MSATYAKIIVAVKLFGMEELSYRKNSFVMTQQEIFREVIALPSNERSGLLRKLERTLKGTGDITGGNHEVRSREVVVAERKRAIDRMRGIASIPGKMAPTGEEWREERTNYLLEKHK